MSLIRRLVASCPSVLGTVAVALGCSQSDPATSSGSAGTGNIAGGAPQAGASGVAGSGAAGAGAGAGSGAGAGGSGNAGGSGGSALGGAAGSATTAGTSSGGATPTAGADTGGSAQGGAAPTGFLSATFESDEVGKQPAGWDNFIGYVKNSANPQGDIMAVVDSTRAHLGTKSVHFHAGASGQAFLMRALPTGTNKLYVRAWFYMTRQLGQNPGANHETLIGINKDKDNEVRFGEIKGVIGTNEVPTDNISPKMDMWGKGPLIAANKWACIEVAFIGDQAQHELHAWADGTLVHEVTNGDQWQNGTMPATWLAGKFDNLILGWQSFSSASNDVWMDDLVLSTSPIGCN